MKTRESPLGVTAGLMSYEFAPRDFLTPDAPHAAPHALCRASSAAATRRQQPLLATPRSVSASESNEHLRQTKWQLHHALLQSPSPRGVARSREVPGTSKRARQPDRAEQPRDVGLWSRN